MTYTTSKSKAGLNRREAEEVLRAFLSSETQDKVFVLKGDWGVGKTHLVQTFLSTQKEYYYSSVFGISSIEELKMQLWSNFKPAKREEEHENSHDKPLRKILKYINDNSGNLGKVVGRDGSGVASSAISLISNVLVNNMLKGQLICIDDLERKSKKLQLDEVLGFIERLVEDQECKVIIIFNEDKVCEDQEAKKTLTEYREKVIDIEIKLDPSADENFYIGFGKDDPDEKIIFDYLRRQNVQTNNIRVLKKLRFILGKLRSHIEDLLPIIRHKILEEIIFISLSKFDKKFPVALDNLLSLGDYSKILFSGTDEDKKLYSKAIDLGYSRSSISDEIICLVETSVCDYEKFAVASKQLNDTEKAEKIREKLRESYKPYSESFGSSEEELRNNLTNFLNTHSFSLDSRQFGELEEIAQAIDLDLTSYKKSWLKCRINTFNTLGSLRPILQEYPDFLQEYPDLILELEKKIKSIEETMSITHVLSQSLKNKSWSKEETDYLDGRTVEDYKRWLLERNPDQYDMIKQGLRMGENCPTHLRRAIVELAKESKLNAMRAKNLYNIDI